MQYAALLVPGTRGCSEHIVFAGISVRKLHGFRLLQDTESITEPAFHFPQSPARHCSADGTLAAQL